MAHAGIASRLEAGEIVAPAGVAFTLSDAEAARIARGVAAGRAKNVSLDPTTGAVRGASEDALVDGVIAALMRRHAQWALQRIVDVAPAYGPHLRMGRASLRTRDAGAPALSPRKDDRRLHADAFPSRPTGGDRILRVFNNINPAGQARLWRVGEPFEAYARRWLDQIRRPWPGEAWLLQRLGVTRGARTDYDALMLGLHDRAKLDETYQREAPSREVSFAAGSSWMVFTDGVVHAAMSGCFALEQTFHLPIAGMETPDASPLRVLERLTGRGLV
jgi:hypothetical protein